MRLDLQGIHEDISGMCVSSKMGHRSVHPESASDVDESQVFPVEERGQVSLCEWYIYFTTAVRNG